MSLDMSDDETENYDFGNEIARRFSFKLKYGYEPDREITVGGLSGPDITNAYNPESKTSGEWDHWDYPGFLDGKVHNERAWSCYFAEMAIGEAVHEALEYLKKDGVPWLDPHGVHEGLIFRAVAELVVKLDDIKHQPHGKGCWCNECKVEDS